MNREPSMFHLTSDMIHPKDESFVNHTKTLTNRRSLRFSVTSPYVEGLEEAVFFGSFSSAARRNERTVRTEPRFHKNMTPASMIVNELGHLKQVPVPPFLTPSLSSSAVFLPH